MKVILKKTKEMDLEFQNIKKVDMWVNLNKKVREKAQFFILMEMYSQDNLIKIYGKYTDIEQAF